MSIHIMSKVWTTDLPTVEKMVLLVIADHASDDGTEAWPSQATMASKASISIRSVQRAVNSLVEKGFIRMEKGKGGSVECREDRRPHRYTIFISRLRGDNLTGREEERGDIDDIYGATLTTSTGRQSRPMNHPLEPSNETSAFNQFREVYPRRDGGRIAIEKALDKALKIASLEEILAGAKRYAQDPNRKEDYTKMATTWLNKGCWDDPLLPAQEVPLKPGTVRLQPQTNLHRIGVGGIPICQKCGLDWPCPGSQESPF